MRLAVVVPCRDEAAVLPRKLANLAACAWPASARAHRLVIVDDGSRDGTLAIARAQAARSFGGRSDVEVRAIANTGRPGKPSAVRSALAEIGPEFELVVLTDADVIGSPQSLRALAEAFEREPRLALACGAQRFVRDLAADGSVRGEDGGEPRAAAGLFDRATAVVRRLESRAGLLFSVHGQLCAWRPALGIAPTPGVAADDLDLRFQVLARVAEPRRVELVPGAVFHEIKTPAGPARRAQMQRRARAWFQALWRSAPPYGLIPVVQWSFYRYVPARAPLATLLLAAAAPALAWALAGEGVGLAIAAAVLALGVSPPGRRWLDLMRTIHAADRSEARAPLADAWEMSRT